MVADFQVSSPGGPAPYGGFHDQLASCYPPPDYMSFTFSQHLLYPELASLALSTPLLETVSSLLGPNLVQVLPQENQAKVLNLVLCRCC